MVTLSPQVIGYPKDWNLTGGMWVGEAGPPSESDAPGLGSVVGLLRGECKTWPEAVCASAGGWKEEYVRLRAKSSRQLHTPDSDG